MDRLAGRIALRKTLKRRLAIHRGRARENIPWNLATRARTAMTRVRAPAGRRPGKPPRAMALIGWKIEAF
jgi:hypothetical protein